MKYLIYSVEVHFFFFTKETVEKHLPGSFRNGMEEQKELQAHTLGIVILLNPVFCEHTDFPMQLGLLPLDNEIAILCHRINYLSGSFKQFQRGEFKNSSICSI